MVENLILHAPILSLLLNALNFLFVVTTVKHVKLLELDYSVFVVVYLLEQSSDFICFQRQIEAFTQVDLEVSESQEPNLVGVQFYECFLDVHSFDQSFLDRLEHPEQVDLLIKLGLHLSVSSLDIVRRHLMSYRHLHSSESVVLLLLFSKHVVVCVS